MYFVKKKIAFFSTFLVVSICAIIPSLLLCLGISKINQSSINIPNGTIIELRGDTTPEQKGYAGKWNWIKNPPNKITIYGYQDYNTTPAAGTMTCDANEFLPNTCIYIDKSEAIGVYHGPFISTQRFMGTITTYQDPYPNDEHRFQICYIWYKNVVYNSVCSRARSGTTWSNWYDITTGTVMEGTESQPANLKSPYIKLTTGLYCYEKISDTVS